MSVHQSLIELRNAYREQTNKNVPGAGDADDKVNLNGESTGNFIDFLHRVLFNGNASPELVARLLHKTLHTLPDGKVIEKGPFTEMECCINGDGSGYKLAEETVARESLTSLLMRRLTVFWKARGDPAWAPDSDSLWQRVAVVAKAKKMRACYRVEVRFALKREALISKLVANTVTSESTSGRHHRLQSFWQKYHEKSHDVDVARGRAASPASTLRPLSAGRSPISPSSTPAWRQRPTTPQRQHQMLRPRSSPSLPGPCTPATRVAEQPVPARTGATVMLPRAAVAWSSHLDSEDRPFELQLVPKRSGSSPSFGKRISSSEDLQAHLRTWKTRPSRSRCTYQSPGNIGASFRQGSLGAAASWMPQGSEAKEAASGREYFQSLLDTSLGFESVHRGDKSAQEQNNSIGRHRKTRTVSSSASSALRRTPAKTTGRSFSDVVARAKDAKDKQGRTKPKSGGALADLTSPTRAIREPWSPSQVKRMQGDVQPASPTKAYIQVCDSMRVLPQLQPLVTGDSTRFDAQGKTLSNADLEAIAEMIWSSGVEEVILDGNTLLTDAALAEFLDSLQMGPTRGLLQRLSLKRCLGASFATMQSIVALLSGGVGATSLLTLDLSGVQIGAMFHVPLSEAIRDHHKLERVCLADTGIGSMLGSRQSIGALFGSRTVTSLDISWNIFTKETFHLIGERLVEGKTLAFLGIANCAARCESESVVAGNFTPIYYLLEYLAHASSVTHVDLSLNRIDFRGALVLEDSLANSSNLKWLELSHNPIGVLGMRSILRLLMNNTCGLKRYTCEDCCTGEVSDNSMHYQVFNATSPGGRYTFDFSRPYHRSLLRMLYKAAERFGLTNDQAFSNIVVTSGRFEHARKDARGVWQVLDEGCTSLTFSVELALERELKDFDVWDFRGIMHRLFSTTRLEPGFKKVIPMLCQWARVEGNLADQLAFLDAISKDFQLTLPQVEMLCGVRALASQVLTRCLPRVMGGFTSHYLSLMRLPLIGDYVSTLTSIKELTLFNVDNPTAHYKLDLAQCGEHAVAEHLIALDAWEIGLGKQLKYSNVSQNGNFSNVRNLTYNQRPLDVFTISQWSLPERLVLQFDYVSNRRPPEDAPVLDKATFSKILLMLQSATEMSPTLHMQALRIVSHHMYVSSMQVRELLGIYRNESDRADLMVVFFCRIVDMMNEKVFRVRFDNPNELDSLRHRLGFATYFPFMQPEQATFRFDFAQYDQRVAANELLKLATKESRGNLRNALYIHKDGTRDSLPQGIPRGWDAFEKMPKDGHFEVLYLCSADERNFKYRKHLLESFSRVKTGSSEQDVLWWASLTEAPPDVVEFLEWITTRWPPHEHPSPAKAAFRAIDGPGGNGLITLKEFQEAYKELGCKKFKGANENQRILTVFRYLDPSGEGQVSRGEWAVLEALGQEIQLSIFEFVQFCMRTFGEDLQDAWEVLDEDESGEVDEEEWSAALARLGFFGPSLPIFHYLDKDGEGSVSIDEFQALIVFQEMIFATAESV